MCLTTSDCPCRRRSDTYSTNRCLSSPSCPGLTERRIQSSVDDGSSQIFIALCLSFRQIFPPGLSLIISLAADVFLAATAHEGKISTSPSMKPIQLKHLSISGKSLLPLSVLFTRRPSARSLAFNSITAAEPTTTFMASSLLSFCPNARLSKHSDHFSFFCTGTCLGARAHDGGEIEEMTTTRPSASHLSRRTAVVDRS